MAFRALRNLDFDPKSNSTVSLTQLPASLLDAFIPGYSVLSRFLFEILGFDISAIVSIALLLFAISTGGQFLAKQISAQFLRWFSCSITVDAYDPIYDHILAWAAENKSLQRVRSLRGHSAGESTDEDVIDIKVDDDFAEDSIFNFNNWAAKAPPRYEPHTNSGLFWHKGTSGYGNWFSITRDRERVPGGWMGMMMQDTEKLTLTVLGRSTKPLKQLIVEMRDAHLSHRTAMTVIRRPSPKEQRGRGRHAWNKVASRPSRPMGTVVLDDLQKATILRDINDFLHPRTPRWYANRGIPYRRGYLFHGPPGTGKTSLSFALAGVFGLDIYCLSLSEATLTEEDLILLFNSLPKRCVVLLEDIDSAGVLRKKEADEEENEGKSKKGGRRNKSEGQKNDAKDQKSTDEPTKAEPSSSDIATATAIAAEVAKAIKSATSDDSPSPRGGGGGGANKGVISLGITMSGLLNAIDGVASQEGRVLVMTTNYPEKLDDALIRPGRVDMKIEFGLARHEQIRELFMRMYVVDEKEGARGVPKTIGDVLPQGWEELSGEKAKAAGASKAEGLDLAVNIATTPPASTTKTHHEPPTPPLTPKPALNSAGNNMTANTPLSKSNSASDFADTNTTTDTAALEIDDSMPLPLLAALFASALPDAVFSPAEIQGFLLTRKKSPLQAVRDVGRWRDEEVRRKEGRRNVVVREDEEEVGEDKVEDGEKGGVKESV